MWDLREDFPAAGLNVEGCASARHPLGHGTEVAPRGTLFRGPALEPGEVPALHRRCVALSDELLDARRRSHQLSVDLGVVYGNAVPAERG